MWIYLSCPETESMDWTYSAESEESASPSATGCEQSPIVKSIDTASLFCCRGCTMGNCTKHPYGTMLVHLMDTYCQDTLISYSVDSHAKTSVLQEMELAWKESAADYFTRSSGCVAKLSQDSSFWRTYQPSLVEEEPKWSEKLPRWGMTVVGALYPQRPLEQCTDARGGSYWLTPSTMEHLPVRKGEALERALHRGNSTSRRKVSGRLNEQVAYPHMWPTPCARDWKDSGREPANQKRNTPSLPTKVMMFPTPNTSDALNANWKNDHDIKKGYLRAVALLATPTDSQALKPIRAPSPSRQKGEHGEDLQDSIGRINPDLIGKKLSVEFVECLMAFPIKWTDLNPLVTAWYQSKRKKRSKS